MPEAHPLPQRRERSDNLQPEAKTRLIDATIAAIAEHGLSGLTLARVAARVDLTAASVNFHFTSKEALLVATLRAVAEEFEQSISHALERSSDDAGERLQAIVEASLDRRLTEPGKVAVWYAFLAESRARADYQQICGARDEAYFQIVLELCKALIDTAPAGRRPDAEAVTYGLVGLIDELWQEILFEGGRYDPLAARHNALAYLASVFPWRFDQPDGAAAAPQVGGIALADVERDGLVYTLPAWVYNDEEFFELEKEKIFLPAWQLVCHVSDLPKAGSFVTFDIFDERAFVIRGKDERIRAFHNVCRHRAHSVVQGAAGQCKGMVVCPYHGWSYDFDGSRKGLSSPDTFRDHERRRFGLVEIELEIFLGFVFIRFSAGGPSVAAQFAPVVEEFERYRTTDMVKIQDGTFKGRFWEEVVAVDWKNGYENYVEDYHFPIGHAGLSALMDSDYDREALDTGIVRLSHRMRNVSLPNWSAARYRGLLPDVDHLSAAMRERWTYYAMFPNTFFDLFPDMMDFFQMIPLGPGRIRLRGASYGLLDDSRTMRAVRYLNGRINRRVQTEDNVLTEQVQRGLRSSSYSLGILSDKECAVHHFQNWIRRRLPASRLAAPPPRGSLAQFDARMAAARG